MAINRVNPSRIGIAILAKAPVPGFAKTRLLPALSAATAARIHRELTLRTLRTACNAGLGKLSLWCAPDPQQRFFRAIARSKDLGPRVALQRQVDGDLGQRMAAVFAGACGPLLLVGTDCPAMTIDHLRQAAQVLEDGSDAVFIPAEDGGYALVGLRQSVPELFAGIEWGSDQVFAQTRERMKQHGLRWRELETLWDVDRPEDVVRWRARSFENAMSPVGAGGTLSNLANFR